MPVSVLVGCVTATTPYHNATLYTCLEHGKVSTTPVFKHAQIFVERFSHVDQRT